MRLKARLVIVWSIACLLWSGTFLAIKVGVGQVPPITLAWLRLLIAATVLCPIVLVRRSRLRITPRDTLHVVLAGVLLLGVNYGLTFWGAQFVPSGTVAILQPAAPLMALFFGWCLGAEIVTHRKIAALVAGAVGVAITFRAETRVPDLEGLTGSLAILGGAGCVAAAYVWLKRFAPKVDPLSVTTLQCVAGLIPLMIVGLLIDGGPLTLVWTPQAVGALLYLSVGASVLAFWLNYWLLQRMDPSAMLMISIAEVPIAVALGAIVLGERVSASSLVGGAWVLAGAALALTSPSRPDGTASVVS